MLLKQKSMLQKIDNFFHTDISIFNVGQKLEKMRDNLTDQALFDYFICKISPDNPYDEISAPFLVTLLLLPQDILLKNIGTIVSVFDDEFLKWFMSNYEEEMQQDFISALVTYQSKSLIEKENIDEIKRFVALFGNKGSKDFRKLNDINLLETSYKKFLKESVCQMALCDIYNYISSKVSQELLQVTLSKYLYVIKKLNNIIQIKYLPFIEDSILCLMVTDLAYYENDMSGFNDSDNEDEEGYIVTQDVILNSIKENDFYNESLIVKLSEVFKMNENIDDTPHLQSLFKNFKTEFFSNKYIQFIDGYTFIRYAKHEEGILNCVYYMNKTIRCGYDISDHIIEYIDKMTDKLIKFEDIISNSVKREDAIRLKQISFYKENIVIYHHKCDKNFEKLYQFLMSNKILEEKGANDFFIQMKQMVLEVFGTLIYKNNCIYQKSLSLIENLYDISILESLVKEIPYISEELESVAIQAIDTLMRTRYDVDDYLPIIPLLITVGRHKELLEQVYRYNNKEANQKLISKIIVTKK